MGAIRRVLNSNLVREWALPLRTAHPSAYALLNRLRQRLLSGRSELAAYQANAMASFRQLASLPGARVLEVGSDPQLRVLQTLRGFGARQAIGINNAEALFTAAPVLHGGSGVELRRGDATALEFDDQSFDYIFSVATFEHIVGLPAALAEMFRVLKPGGLLYANFGPLWSGGKGHHLRVTLGEEQYQHFLPERNPLPDFCHLLLTAEQLRASLTLRVPLEAVEPIVYWVYEDGDINRLFAHQYLSLFDQSPFQLRSMAAERDPIDPQLLRILRFRYPQEQAFDITNMEAVLLKPRSAGPKGSR